MKDVGLPVCLQLRLIRPSQDRWEQTCLEHILGPRFLSEVSYWGGVRTRSPYTLTWLHAKRSSRRKGMKILLPGKITPEVMRLARGRMTLQSYILYGSPPPATSTWMVSMRPRAW